MKQNQLSTWLIKLNRKKINKNKENQQKIKK